METVAIGKVVVYTLTTHDVEMINRRRADARERMDWHRALKSGAQVHVGNTAEVGQSFPMIVTRVWGTNQFSAFNGQVMLDGNDTLWVTSAHMGDGRPGSAMWPAS
jgi:hypothetical protein